MPMPLPQDNDGQAGHGSQPWYSRADDAIYAKVAIGAMLGADAIGLTNASRHLRHYLDNTGTDLTISPDQMMHDDPGLKNKVDGFATDAVRPIVADPSNRGKSVSFDMPWTESYTFSQTGQQDWFYAVGSLHFTVCGVVSIPPQSGDKSQPRVTIDFKCYIYDRYNWDGTKSTTIAGFEVTDRRMGALHTAGYAQEFNMFGTSSTQHYEGVLPTNGSIDFPDSPDSRDGDRTDPTR